MLNKFNTNQIPKHEQRILFHYGYLMGANAWTSRKAELGQAHPLIYCWHSVMTKHWEGTGINQDQYVMTDSQQLRCIFKHSLKKEQPWDRTNQHLYRLYKTRGLISSGFSALCTIWIGEVVPLSRPRLLCLRRLDFQHKLLAPEVLIYRIHVNEIKSSGKPSPLSLAATGMQRGSLFFYRCGNARDTCKDRTQGLKLEGQKLIHSFPRVSLQLPYKYHMKSLISIRILYITRLTLPPSTPTLFTILASPIRLPPQPPLSPATYTPSSSTRPPLTQVPRPPASLLRRFRGIRVTADRGGTVGGRVDECGGGDTDGCQVKEGIRGVIAWKWEHKQHACAENKLNI